MKRAQTELIKARGGCDDIHAQTVRLQMVTQKLRSKRERTELEKSELLRDIEAM